MKIHSMIFIAQLKSITSSPDSYDRNFVLDSSIVLNEHANIDVFFYEIKRLIDKRIIKDKTHYLIKWKNCEHQHNVWYFINNLQNVVDFITKYEAIAFRKSIKKKFVYQYSSCVYHDVELQHLQQFKHRRNKEFKCAYSLNRLKKNNICTKINEGVDLFSFNRHLLWIKRENY